MKRYTKTEIIDKANEVIKNNKLNSPPINLDLICKKNSIRVNRVNTNRMENRLQRPISGLITNLDGDFNIYVNEKDAPRRQRFTIAHELGHFFLHTEKNNIQTIISFRGESNPIETEANNFAAELLMPRDMLKHQIEQLNKGDKFLLRDDVICEIAKIFDVSEIAAEIRLKELGYL